MRTIGRNEEEMKLEQTNETDWYIASKDVEKRPFFDIFKTMIQLLLPKNALLFLLKHHPKNA
jgi:hypothetical protein